MWTLQCEKLFGGKRVWLKPGSRLLIGRTPPGDHDGGIMGRIDDKHVSRKHIVISVSEVTPGDGTKLHSRSKIEIADSSKFGTQIDGDKKIVNDTAVLPGTEHTLKLAAWPPLLHIKWEPIVFTYAHKENKDFKARSAKLHELDIKTSVEFVFDKTTHVVSHKRNLSKVLQGLVSGKHIVTPAFLDAVLQAATSSGDLEQYTPSQLEVDFDKFWPDAAEYTTPKGQEPVPRPPELLKPDSSRSEIFSGLTFIFLDDVQYTNLANAVSGGGGKALKFPIIHGETTVEEYVDFVRSTAGKKRGGNNGNDRLPVITIRLTGFPEGMEEWASAFVNGVDRALNQRSMLQNEFLDVILTKDTSSLQKPPPEEIEVNSSIAVPARTSSSMREPTPSQPLASQSQANVQSHTNIQSQQNVESQSQLQPEAAVPTTEPKEEPKPVMSNPRKRPFRRGATTSRFTGFDDYEPPAKSRRIEEEEDTPMSGIPESTTVLDSFRESQSQGPTLPIISGQNNRSPSPEAIPESNLADELLPAATAIKRRRLEAHGTSASPAPDSARGISQKKNQATTALEALRKAKKKVLAQDVDVREQTKQRLLAAEEKRRQDEESLHQALEGVDISEIRNLVQIEDMEVRPRADKPTASSRDHRWNDEWNGRRNFKKFRQRGTIRGPQPQKIIVPLEEVPLKGKGVQDSYFLEDPKSKDKDSQRSRTNQAPLPPVDGSSEPETGFIRRGRKDAGKEKGRGKQAPETIVIDSDNPDDEMLPEEIAGTPRSKRIAGRVRDTQNQTQTQIQRDKTSSGLGTSILGRGKRPATTAAGDSVPRKRVKAAVTATATATVVEDSDEEESGFRFRRRR